MGPLGTRDTGRGLQGPCVCRFPAHCLSCSTAWSTPLTLESPGTGQAWGHSAHSSPGVYEAHFLQTVLRDLPEGPEVRLCTSMAGGTGSIPAQGTKIPRASQCGQKKRKTPASKAPCLGLPHFPRQSPRSAPLSSAFPPPSSLCLYSVSSVSPPPAQKLQWAEVCAPVPRAWSRAWQGGAP